MSGGKGVLREKTGDAKKFYDCNNFQRCYGDTKNPTANESREKNSGGKSVCIQSVQKQSEAKVFGGKNDGRQTIGGQNSPRANLGTQKFWT